ncbi:hypothetical protein [Altericista sp. CCNU0014]|uniref:hypothetical protein n=1 Tax=Altericista sp. CCNU0014 TaxID=3082949 RepID=UPI00384BDB5C
MALRGRRWLQVSFKKVRVPISVGLMSVSTGGLTIQANAQSQTTLRSVCVGIKSSQYLQAQPKTLQDRCCQQSAKAKCLKWQEIFPATRRLQSPSIERPTPAADSFPKIDAFGNSTGSEGAAKDAVIQVGITKAWDAVAPTLKKNKANPKGNRSANFFERLYADYQRILGPRELKSGAILTPQVGMNMDVGRFNVDAMKVGVEIKF